MTTKQTSYVAVVGVPSNPSPGTPGVIFHNTTDQKPYYDDGTTIEQIARQSDLATKQNTLTAGSGISIVGNTISATGGGGGTQNLFVQNASPVSPPSTYLWVQTGLGTSGNDFTFWIEDGQ